MRSGLLLVDKPCGTSSAGVIRALGKRLGDTKVGHLGTLDPFASGLLPLCLGEATKIARYLLLEDKCYTGTIRLGTATDTLDRTGVETERVPVPPLVPAAVEEAARRFRGAITQVPPMYSALKRGGVPLYKLARRGIQVEREARQVVVHELAVTIEGPEDLGLALRCSKGTYVRVLAADLACALGTVGHLSALRRTRVGPLAAEDAWTVERLLDEPLAAWPLVAVREALSGLRAFEVSPQTEARLRHGQQRPLAALPSGRPGEAAVLVSSDGAEVIALVEAGGGGEWRLVRMLQPPALQG